MPDARTIHRSPNILAWLAGKTAADFAAIRRGQHNYFPDAITFYLPDGTPREEPILIREPAGDDRMSARVDAILYVAGKVPRGSGFKVETVKAAQEFIGDREFEQIDSCAIAARCMHDPKLPAGDALPPPWKKLGLLLTDHKVPAILDVYERMNLLANTFSPRVDELTESTLWMCAHFMAKEENASPLGAMSAATQFVFAIWLAKQAVLGQAASEATSNSS